MKNLSKKFSSLNEFSTWLSTAPVAGYYKKNALHASEYTSESTVKFTGTKDYPTAADLMLHGWKDGAKRVQAAMIRAASVTGSRPRCYNSVVGFAPNVPNHLAGIPLDMINKKHVRVPARVVDIVYNCACDFSITSGEIENAAAKLFNVVAGLEKSGIRVNLWVVCINFGNNQNASLAVKIKTASQPFNLLKMVYPCVHPSFLRRQYFAALERMGVTGPRAIWQRYGRVITDSAQIKNSVAAFGIADTNIFDYYTLAGKTETQIAGMIK